MHVNDSCLFWHILTLTYQYCEWPSCHQSSNYSRIPIPYYTKFYITRWTHGPQNLQRPIRTLIMLLGFLIKKLCVVSGFEISKWMHLSVRQVDCKITCPNVPFTCLKYIKRKQLMWKSEIHSRQLDMSCRYSTCPTVIFTRLRQSDEWNFEPWICVCTARAVDSEWIHIWPAASVNNDGRTDYLRLFTPYGPFRWRQ